MARLHFPRRFLSPGLLTLALWLSHSPGVPAADDALPPLVPERSPSLLDDLFTADELQPPRVCWDELLDPPLRMASRVDRPLGRPLVQQTGPLQAVTVPVPVPDGLDDERTACPLDCPLDGHGLQLPPSPLPPISSLLPPIGDCPLHVTPLHVARNESPGRDALVPASSELDQRLAEIMRLREQFGPVTPLDTLRADEPQPFAETLLRVARESAAKAAPTPTVEYNPYVAPVGAECERSCERSCETCAVATAAIGATGNEPPSAVAQRVRELRGVVTRINELADELENHGLLADADALREQGNAVRGRVRAILKASADVRAELQNQPRRHYLPAAYTPPYSAPAYPPSAPAYPAATTSDITPLLPPSVAPARD